MSHIPYSSGPKMFRIQMPVIKETAAEQAETINRIEGVSLLGCTIS